MAPAKTIGCLKKLGAIGGTWAALLCSGLGAASGADFSVASPGYYYSINSMSPDPMLAVVRGKTYTFSIAASSIHPFKILAPGTVNNDIYSGTITWTVPLTASNYNYICSIHGFGGQITTTAPPPPPAPTIKILGLSVGTNLTVLSTGTNSWKVLPEFNTNLVVTNWYSLTVQTNLYANGTNETICGRPPGSPIFIRIRSQPN